MSSGASGPSARRGVRRAVIVLGVAAAVLLYPNRAIPAAADVSPAPIRQWF